MRLRRILASVLFVACMVCSHSAAFQSAPTPHSSPLPAPWRDALAGYQFAFPRDHASHPEYKVEWWYYTGNLRDAKTGRRFGYQLTFFRVGVDPSPKNPSRWAVRDLFMTHLAVSDLDGGRYRFTERLNRAGVGWAGAAVDEYRVWNEDWEARGDERGRHLLRAMDETIGVDLTLASEKPPIVHGSRGISQKGAKEGNASHYYSLTRVATTGSILIEGERFEVEGASWMDHEFGTSFLEPDQRGWDWFSIQLDDGTDLMIFQIRRDDGSRDPHSSGTIVSASGASTAIGLGDFTLDSASPWASPASGASYPLSWRVNIPNQALELEVRTPLPDQELRTERSTGVTYWEGAVEVTGTHEGRPVSGRGYLEMTGYSGTSMGAVLSNSTRSSSDGLSPER
jgi:predicted secreted hydrolase